MSTPAEEEGNLTVRSFLRFRGKNAASFAAVEQRILAGTDLGRESAVANEDLLAEAGRQVDIPTEERNRIEELLKKPLKNTRFGRLLGMTPDETQRS